MSVRDRAQQKVENKAKWLDENPGFGGLDEFIEWISREYPESDPKIYIEKALKDSPAYRALSRIAQLVYLDFLGKRSMKRIKRNNKKVWMIENNGKIVYPYEEAEQRGISRSQFRNAIDELQQNGLIDITHQGRGGRKPAEGTGDFTTYWIDDRWEKYGTEDFRPPRHPRKKDTRKGMGFGSIWEDRERGAEMNRKAQATLKSKKLSIENDTCFGLTSIENDTRQRVFWKWHI